MSLNSIHFCDDNDGDTETDGEKFRGNIFMNSPVYLFCLFISLFSFYESEGETEKEGVKNKIYKLVFLSLLLYSFFCFLLFYVSYIGCFLHPIFLLC